MIERKTALEQAELSVRGYLGIKIAFLLVEGDLEHDRKWHRMTITFEDDPAAQMQAVNDHLAMMEPPMPPVSQADIDFVVQCHALLKQRMAA